MNKGPWLSDCGIHSLQWALAIVVCLTLATMAHGCADQGAMHESVPTAVSTTDLPSPSLEATGTSSTLSTTSTLSTLPPTSTVPDSTTSATLGAVFQLIAQAMSPLPAYGIPELPAGTELASEWWPIVQYEDPGACESERRANPRISGEGTQEPQADLLLRMGEEGWLLLFQNMRGDLGDVRGLSVGMVENHEAILYDVSGGKLVQWSDSGRWYGVFARGVSEDRLVEIALTARLVEPK